MPQLTTDSVLCKIGLLTELLFHGVVGIVTDLAGVSGLPVPVSYSCLAALLVQAVRSRKKAAPNGLLRCFWTEVGPKLGLEN